MALKSVSADMLVLGAWTGRRDVHRGSTNAAGIRVIPARYSVKDREVKQ